MDFDPSAFVAQNSAPAPESQADASNFDPESFINNAQQSQYGTPGQQTLAGIEGVARGVAGPLATAVEKYAYRIPEENIRGRQEANPITAGAGEAAGLVGGALTGIGEAAVLEKIGKGAAEAAGLGKAASYSARVGSSIVKNAAEMAAYQGGDEITKAILDDPNAGAQSAIANMGLATAIGGVGGGLMTGVASPLWNATIGTKVNDGLKALVSRWGGIEGEAGGGLSKAEDLATRAGVEVPGEIGAVLNDQPMARESHSVLSQDDSSMAGRAYQKKLQDLDAQLGIRTAEALGRSPDDILNIAEKNSYETGQNLGNTLHDELKPVVDDINNRYDTITEKFKSKPNSAGVLREIADNLSQKAIQEGWAKSSEDANIKRIEKILSKLPEQTTIADLKNEISNLYVPFDAPDARAVSEARKILTNGIESSIAEHMGAEELANYGQLRKDYALLSNHLEDLDQHLHVGKWNGPKTFLEALKEKANSKGETLLSNMAGKNNAALLENLRSHPNTLEAISNHYKDEAIRAGTKRTMPGELLNTNALLDNVNKLSPQQKSLIATPEQHAKIEAVHAIKEGLKDPNHNFSNTARTLRKQMHGAVSPLSLIAILMGHGEAGILSYISSLGLNEVRPGMRLALLKFLGSAKPVDAAGFAAASQYFTAAQKGAKVLSTAAENVFKPGSQVLMTSQMPTSAELAHLDKLVASDDSKTTNKIMDAAKNGHVGHYLPEQQTALTQGSIQALQYLKGLKPDNPVNSPLDVKIPPTPSQEARYQRALEIAQQPAIVLKRVKDGTIQLSDLQDLNGMYPALYPQLAQKLSNEMITAKDNGVTIPYKTRVGVSLFLGQALDTSMQPASILAAQPQPKMPPQPVGPKISNKRGTSTLGKSNASYRTPNQAAAADRANRD